METKALIATSHHMMPCQAAGRKTIRIMKTKIQIQDFHNSSLA